MGTLYGIGQGFADLINKIRPPEDAGLSPEKLAQIKDIRSRAAEKYKQYMAENAPAIPSAGDIHGGKDFALYAANRLGGMAPYLANALNPAALPTMISMGAAQSGEQEAQTPDATAASIATAAGLGGATGALRVPFLTGSGGVLSRAAKGALVGGPVIGAAQGLTGNIPRAVATGDPSEGLPTSPQVWDAILGNSLGMGAFGGIHAAGEKALNKLTNPAPESGPQEHADARLAGRIKDTAEQNGFDLSKVAYDAGDGSKQALDTVHNQLAEDMKGVWDVVKGDLDRRRSATSTTSSTARRSTPAFARRATRSKAASETKSWRSCKTL
jgi:hypothetical protein